MFTNPEVFVGSLYTYAKDNTGCLKIAVGACVKVDDRFFYGSNISIPSCDLNGCLRKQLTGSDSKDFRGAAYCNAVHAEQVAIHQCLRHGYSTKGACMITTRYPCESCARAIVMAGIKHLSYGGVTRISKLTEEILKSGGVVVEHLRWENPDEVLS